MSDMRINQVAHSNITGGSSNKTVKKETVIEPRDQFQLSSGEVRLLDRNTVNKFFEEAGKIGKSKDSDTDILLPSVVSTAIPVISGNEAGWSVKLMEQGKAGAFMKIPINNGNRFMIVPLENKMGGKHVMPAIIDPEKGIIDSPDFQAFKDAGFLSFSKSPDGNDTYIYNSQSTRIDKYDKDMNQTGSIVLTTFDSSNYNVRTFTAGKNENYVFARKKDSNAGILIALDPKSGNPLWSKDYNNFFIQEIKEGPDGNIYVMMTGFYDAKASIDVYSPRGELINKYEGLKQPEGKTLKKGKKLKNPSNLTFTPDGNIVITDERAIRYIKTRTKTGAIEKRKNPDEMWKIEGEFRNLQVSDDGKHIFAVDIESDFSRSHNLMKINLETGKIEWQRKKKNEFFADYKIMGDNIALLTSDRNHQSAKMTMLDMKGKETWQGSHPCVMDESDIGKIGAITDKGDFMIGDKDQGTFTILHPVKPGETKESIEKSLLEGNSIRTDLHDEKERVKSENLKKAESNDEPKVELHETFVVIGGIKLKKNTQDNPES